MDEEPFSLENWPDLGSGAHSENTRKHHRWLKNVSNMIKSLVERVGALENENSQLKSKVLNLEKGSSREGVGSGDKLPFSQIAARLAKPGTAENNAIIKAVSLNVKQHDIKSKNIVIAGIATSTKSSPDEIQKDDKELVANVLESIGANVTIKRTSRVKRNANSASTTTSTNDNQSPPPLIVELSSSDERNAVLSVANRLGHAGSNYKHVFIRPDRTKAEQDEFNKLMADKKAANSDLDRNGKLDQPFRFVVRGSRLVCIDVKATEDFDGGQRRPIVDKKTASDARKAPTADS